MVEGGNRGEAKVERTEKGKKYREMGKRREDVRLDLPYRPNVSATHSCRHAD
jgi:hypothetical protein